MRQYVIDFLKLLFPNKDKWTTTEMVGMFAILISLTVVCYLGFKN